MASGQFSDPPSDESISRILGYPTIDVNTNERGKQCSNCGSHDHTSDSCKLPKMEQLLEMFGSGCYDSTPIAVEAKKKIVAELYENQNSTI